nr:MAG TPA: hypothetical protein [Caudoviricetes sp.]
MIRCSDKVKFLNDGNTSQRKKEIKQMKGS